MKGNIVVITVAVLGIITSVAVCRYAMTPPDQRASSVYQKSDNAIDYEDEHVVYEDDAQASSNNIDYVSDYEDKQTSKYDIEFLDAKVGQMESAMKMYDVILVTVRFTNNSDESESFVYAVSAKAFQDGIELKEFVNYDLAEKSEELTEIKSGKSIDVVLPFELRDKTTPIDVEIKERYSDNIWTMTYQFD